MLRGPRIISTGPAPTPIDRILSHTAVRYVLPIVLAAIPVGLGMIIGPGLPRDFYLILCFTAVLVASVLGGYGPGFVAAAIVVIGCATLDPTRLSGSDLRVAGAVGVLIGMLGGTLRSARIKARDRLAANLQLEQQILEIGDEERRRIGHDLHDGLGQHLTGISLLSETISQQLDAGNTPDPANIETITRLMSEAVGITRDLAKSLSPVTLERDGLVAAIEELADTSSSLLNINCDCEFDGGDPLLDRTHSLHLFRIVQEAVNNSVRHGKARNVRIAMNRRGSSLTITVTDDGSGLSSKTMENPGLGLRIMDYLARMLSASLAVERAANATGGTVVTCTLPVHDRRDSSNGESRSSTS